MASTRVKVTHLVVDSGAIINSAPVQDIGSIIYSVPGIVNEIRDRTTRQRLQVLPYEIHFREPPPEAIKFVTDFSKKTGDYQSLSSVDIRLLALAYQLEKEEIGEEHLRREPVMSRTVTVGKKTDRALGNIAGFFMPKKKDRTLPSVSNVIQCDTCNVATGSELEALNQFFGDASYVEGYQPSKADRLLFRCMITVPSPLYPHLLRWYKHIHSYGEELQTYPGEVTDVTEFRATVMNNYKNKEADQDSSLESHFLEIHHSPELDDKEASDRGLVPQETCSENGDPTVDISVKDDEEGGDCEEEDDYGSDEDDGWITSENLEEAQRERDNVSIDEDREAKVACLTTDFSMQNVLKQIGLTVMSVNGMLIKHTKTYILRCYACFKTTSIMTKVFCPRCGNKTLKRVAVTLNEDGSQEIHLSSRVRLTGKGKRFSLPTPKGGKHAENPILCEDQRSTRRLPTRMARQKTDVMYSDYIAGDSPFATHDLYSRSAVLGFHNKGQHLKYWHRRKPSEAKKKK